MIIKKTFLFSLLLASYFCLVGFRMNDEPEIDITKISIELLIGNECEIDVDDGENCYVESENEYVAWVSVEDDKVTITGISEGETTVKISDDSDFENYIAVEVSVSDPFASTTDTSDKDDDESEWFIPMETRGTPGAIPSGFRFVYVKMNGKEVPAWTDDYYYIIYGQLPSGDEAWVIFDSAFWSYITYDPRFMSGSSNEMLITKIMYWGMVLEKFFLGK